MSTQPTKNDVGKIYRVFFRDSEYRKNIGVKPDVPLLTGTLINIVDGDAIIEKSKDETGPARRGYYNDSYRFEEVPSAPAVKTPAGTGLNAARALRTPGGRRKTKKSKRRARKTRRRA